MSSYLKNQSPFLQLVAFIGIYLGCTLIYSLVLMGWLMPRFSGITVFDLQNGNLQDPHLLGVMKLVQMGYSLVSFLLPAWLFFYLSDPDPWGYAQMKKWVRVRPFLIGVGCLLFSLPVVGVLADWNQHIHFGSLDTAIRATQKMAEDMTRAILDMPHTGTLFYNLLLIALIPAIAEEMFFRGVLQRLCIRLTHRAWIGIAIASVVFSLLHGEMLGFLPRVALGAVLGVIYYLSGNLWYSIGLHFINNAVQVCLVFLYQQHYIAYDINQDTPTPLLAGIIGLVVAIGLFGLFRKVTAQKPEQIMDPNRMRDTRDGQEEQS